MEIGGVERSLLGLLNAFDYDKVEVDLLLWAHKGDLMPYLNAAVTLLPEIKRFSYITTPIKSLLKQGHILAALVRFYAKGVSTVRARLTKCNTVNASLCNKIFTRFSKKLPKEYDLALGFFGPHFFLDRKVKAKEKIGWVHTDYTNQAERLDQHFVRPFWSKLDHIACVSHSVKDSFASIFPDMAGKMTVCENILDPQFVRTQAQAFSVEDEMPKDGSFRILSVGRFCTAKAFDEAILACKLLHKKDPAIKWYFIGYGPDEDKLKTLIQEEGTGTYTILLGKKTNPYPYMLSCDLYAQPSRYEGKAVTVQEAQILGKPVLITEFNTARSQLVDGYDGYICPMGVEGIVSGITYLRSHPEVQERIVAGCMATDYRNKDKGSILSAYFAEG